MGELYKKFVCPECGKEFSPEFEMYWGWKNPKDENVCSYTCQRKSEKKAKSKPKQIRNRVPVRIRETGEVFKSISDCAVHLNTSNGSIYRCIDRGIPFYNLHIERVTG